MSLCSDEAVQISLPLNEVFSWKTEFYSFGSYKGTCDFGVLGAAVVKFEEDIPVKASFRLSGQQNEVSRDGKNPNPEWVGLGLACGSFLKGWILLLF